MSTVRVHIRRNVNIWTSLCLILIVLFLPSIAKAQSTTTYRVPVYFFWGDGCPHCAAAKPYLAELEKQYPNMELRAYEVWYVKENQDLFTKMAAGYGFEPQGVPTIMIGDQYWVGYSDTVAKEIENAIKECTQNGCLDHGVGIIPGVETDQPQTIAPAASTVSAMPATIQIPLLGTVDLNAQSIWVSTALIALVDGFNPCSIWVLTMLLAVTLHTGSRKKVFAIGLIFLTVTAAVYGLFITGLFTVFSVVNYLGWIQLIVSLVALFFAIVNIKDYFWYKEGISFTISDQKKPGIYQKMRNVINASQSFWGLAGATVILSAGVSLVEFSCTAGFPMVWTNLLIAQNVTVITFVLLLLLYLIIYQLDELVIFSSAVLTLKASKLEEKHGRMLKLVSGMLMLALALVMLFKPAVMNTLDGSLLVFGAAIVASLLILLIHRVILPRMNIHIGSELNPSKRKTS